MDLSRSRMVLELLTKALEFYANPKNYNKIKKDDDTDGYALLPSLVDLDKGAKAKETILNIKEIMND